MKQDSDGKKKVEQSALDLAQMLPQLHPYGPCREHIRSAMLHSGGTRQGLVAAASAAWSCLPMGSDGTSIADAFQGAFTLETFDHAGPLQSSARNPIPRHPHSLGVCRQSSWHRTCSYWASFHTMALRADLLGLGRRFLHSISNLIAGGATMCGGCTIHFRALHQPVLSTTVARDFGDVY